MTKEKDRSIYKKTLRLAVPMMIQNGITNMVSLIDNVMVGSLGTEVITAVSIVGQLIFVFNLAIFGGLSGPGIYGAQYFGQKNIKGFQNAFRMKIWISLFCLAAGLLVFIFGNEKLISLYLKGESSTIDPVLTMKYAKQYLYIMLAGLLPFTATQVYASSLRESGDSVKPMTAGIISVAVDIIFNYLLIYGKFGFPCLGVRGAAIATAMARFVEMAVVVIWSHAVIRKHYFLKGIYRTFFVPGNLFFKIIIKGLPVFFNEFLWAGSVAALTQVYSGRGLDIVAGLNISNALCNLLNVVFVALGSAVGIIIGQMLGASEYKKAGESSFRLMWFTGAVSAALMIILILFSGAFPQLYNTTDAIRKYGQQFIIITAVFFPVQGFLNSLYFTLRSGGKTVVTFLFDSVYSWTVTFPAAYLMCRFTDLSVFTIYTIVQSADLIKVAVGYFLIKKGLWISNLVEEKNQKENVSDEEFT